MLVPPSFVLAYLRIISCDLGVKILFAAFLSSFFPTSIAADLADSFPTSSVDFASCFAVSRFRLCLSQFVEDDNS